MMMTDKVLLSLTKEQVEFLSILLRDTRCSYLPYEPWADREECKQVERIIEKAMATAEIDWLL